MSFSPDRIAISDISKANPGVVTTSSNHNLTTGQVVRLNVPLNYGMVELNKLQCSVTVLSNTTFSIQYTQVPYNQDVDTRTYSTFTVPSNPSFTAEVLPIGAGPTLITNTSVQTTDRVFDSLIQDATVNFSTTPIPF